MEKLITVKTGVITVSGMLGSYIANMLGGWDMALATLVTFMAIDYFSGIIVAGVFKASSKTECGALQSNAGFKGLCKKAVILAIVLMAYRLDALAGSDFIRQAVIIAYIVNESISIIENAGQMGIPVPDTLSSAIEVLKKKGE